VCLSTTVNVLDKVPTQPRHPTLPFEEDAVGARYLVGLIA